MTVVLKLLFTTEIAVKYRDEYFDHEISQERSDSSINIFYISKLNYLESFRHICLILNQISELVIDKANFLLKCQHSGIVSGILQIRNVI